MSDDAADLAEFLVENGFLLEEDMMAAIADLFPDISDEAFFRGFSIAEETLISDINAAVMMSPSNAEVQTLLQQYARIRDGRPDER